MPAESILLYYHENGLNKLKVFEITDDVIDDILNGESGYHIFHIKIITNLLLRELAQKPDTDYSFSEEDISAISIASSLHDIGKTQIPQSILSKSDTLSPLEYESYLFLNIDGLAFLKRYIDCLISPTI